MKLLRERRSEALGPDQRNEKINAERERDGETEEGFNHRATSDAAEAARKKREQDECAEAYGEVKNVEHSGLRNWFQLRDMGSTEIKSRLGMMQPHVKKT
jgi:hypothetical protein